MTVGASGEVETRLGYRFRDPWLLETALTHSSHRHERQHVATDYERLEFLGDALLGFLVADRLFRDDAEASEGLLSRRRIAVVRRSTLADAAQAMGLGEVVRLGRGEAASGGGRKASVLADVFEAVLGAVYLDGGLRAARAFVRRHLGERLRETEGAEPDDPKTTLQETIQGRSRRTPRYRLVSTSGPAHAMLFEAEVTVAGRVLGRGSGTNRKRAESEAARAALAALAAGDGPGPTEDR